MNTLFTFIKILYISNLIMHCNSVSVSKQLVMITEHPKVTYYDTKHILSMNLTSKRYGRHDYLYYVDFHIYSLHSFGNNVTVHVYIFELLTNVYKRSFLEMHFGVCDFIGKDNIYGAPMRQGRVLNQKCPYAAGPYHFYNMSVPIRSIPRGFPFTKGRVYANLSITATDQVIGSAYIDMELKTIKYNTKT